MPHPPLAPSREDFLRTPSVSITPVTLKKKKIQHKYCKKGMCKNERHLFPCYLSKVTLQSIIIFQPSKNCFTSCY